MNKQYPAVTVSGVFSDTDPVAWEYGGINDGLLRVERLDKTCFPPRQFKFYWSIEFHGTLIVGPGNEDIGNGYTTFEDARDSGLAVLARCREIQSMASCGRIREVANESEG